MFKYKVMAIACISLLPTCSLATESANTEQVPITKNQYEQLALNTRPPFINTMLMRRVRYRQPRKRSRNTNAEIKKQKSARKARQQQ